MRQRTKVSTIRYLALMLAVPVLGSCSGPAPHETTVDTDVVEEVSAGSTATSQITSAAQQTDAQQTDAQQTMASNGAWFVDRAAELGIDFEHQDGRSGERFYVETAASGGGWLDIDADGDLDLYLLNGAATPGSELATTPRNALYENRNGRFVDITDAAGVGDTGYGMGMCVTDLDADGRVDFLVTNYGPDRLFHNLGTGPDGIVRFEEIAEQLGVDGNAWGTSCTFADLDGDQDLDLYVTNYVDFRFDSNPQCGDKSRGISFYCRPDVFNGQPDFLYLASPGDGGLPQFTTRGAERGIAQGVAEKGFGVIASDLDGDDDLDLVVTNDGTPNRLYQNDGRGFFTDRSLLSGLAANRDGQMGSGMGIGVADLGGDASLDVLITNYSFETNLLHINRGDLFFDERTAEAALAQPSYLYVGWGIGAFDADNDGDLDVAVANGHVMDNVSLFEERVTYAQPNQLFINDGSGRFTDLALAPGGAKEGALERAGVSRGLALGDWNNDGKVDLLITNTNSRPALLENQVPGNQPWIGFQLHGPPWNPLALGSRVELYRGQRRLAIREVRSGGSLMSQDDLRANFGLGPASQESPLEVRIRWPDGANSHHDISPDQWHSYVTLNHPASTPLTSERSAANPLP